MRWTKLVPALWAACVVALHAQAEPWSWQQPHARALPTGDLEWTPQPFQYEADASVRYIDYDAGNDDADGRTKQSAWRHHPWDAAATGQARACTGIHTYVFKRGVTYRGSLTIRESGQPGHPIRLTSDPAWGGADAEAVISGARRVTGWKRIASHIDIPEPAKVWEVDLDFAPRNVWMVDDRGNVTRIPLARTPNWKVVDPDDVKSQWWQWDNPGKLMQRATLGNVECHLGIDTVNLTRDPSYYEGAYVWSEYGWVMGTPYPSPVLRFNAEQKSIVFEGQWGRAAGSYHVPRYCRYYLEDKPQYLDDADGEFWFGRDGKGKGGRLFIRLPGEQDPNVARVEVAEHLNLIDGDQAAHLHITGLTFRFTNTYWDLDAGPFKHKDVDPACIRLLGSGTDLLVGNCRFEHVNLPIRMSAIGDGAIIDRVVVRDNVIRYTDHGAMQLYDGSNWGEAHPRGRLLDVKVLRNRLDHIGMRPTRWGQGHAIDVLCAQTCEVAGNMLDRLWGAGIFVFGAKRSAAKVDRPLSRILIHRNKVTDSLLNNNDWGGIETWQGGPAYVFNNISGNPGGYKLWNSRSQPTVPGVSRFGHAYYMDGGFKQYYFNNIAWGKSSDPFGPLGNTAAFQEIHGHFASVFNNTVYNFVIGSRRQAPAAGRNKYMGNIWDTLGHMVFRHADPSNQKADPNAADAGSQASEFEHSSNAYVSNLLHKLPEQVAVFEPDGKWYDSVEAFAKALRARGSIGAVGEVVQQSPLLDAANHDFRPTAAATDRGVKVFVPWALHATVGEWGFYHAGADPTQILDEHLHLAPNFVNREDYHLQPLYPLKAVNVTAADYVDGPLESWTRGALKLNGRDQYAMLSSEALNARVEPPAFEVKNETFDWIRFETPARIVPGQPFEVKLTLTGVAPGQQIKADLHWMRAGKRFGGINASGGPGQPVTGPGPYTFRFSPADKPQLDYFIITAWLTPTGGWKDHTQIARFAVGKGVDAPEGGYRTPRIQTSSFILETYFRSEPGRSGLLVMNMGKAGYRLAVNSAGSAALDLVSTAGKVAAATKSVVNDGQWHHLVAEVDRDARATRLYVDGRLDGEGPGLDPGASLDNDAPLYVGGGPEGGCLAGTMEFLRIARGSFADALTSIDELYAWQFDGPFLKDFTGRTPTGKGRDAGAIEGGP